MKRKFCIILCACFLMSCMVVPASAAENDNFINVLDYATANDSGANYIVADNSSTINFSYSIPVGPVRYLDMIVNTVNGPLSSISVNGTALSILEIKTNFYRVYGSITLSSQLSFTATTTVTNARINITQLKASTFKSFSNSEIGYLALQTNVATSPFYYMPDVDTPAMILFRDYDSAVIGPRPSSDASRYDYLVYAYTSSWKKYDTLDFYFKVNASSVTSLCVTFGDLGIPFTYSYFDVSTDSWYSGFVSGDSSFNIGWDIAEEPEFYFHVSCDISELDRTFNYLPQVCFTGQYSTGDYDQQVTLLSVVGTVINDSRDSDSYWFMQLYNVIDTFRAYTLHYFRELQTSVTTGFTNIGSWFSDLTSSLQTEFKNLKSSLSTHFSNLDTWIQNQTESIVGALDDFDSNFSNLETWIEDQTAAVSEEFRLFRSAVSYHFGNLSTWISDQTTALQTEFTNLNSSLSTHFANLGTWLQDQTTALQTEFTNLRSELLSHFKALTEDLQFSLLNVRAAIGDLATNLNTWILNQTTALQLEFTNLKTSLNQWILDHTAAITEQFRLFRIAVSTHFERLSGWIQEQTSAIVDAIVGDSSSGDELEEDSQQIQDGVEDIGKFEEDQQAILDNNFDQIQSAVTITGFAAALAFVQKYTNMIFGGLGDVIIVFSMPLFLGLFFYICSRVPGATRWRPREPKGDSK